MKKDSEYADRIVVGTSGYSFPDWAGIFYPKGLKRELWLSYYIRNFNALELNTTFYALPKPENIAKMANILPKNFYLFIKLPQDFTHNTEMTPSQLMTKKNRLMESISCLTEKGIVHGYLAQFPVSFRPDERTVKRVEFLFSICPKPLFIEFRNGAWNRKDILSLMRKNETGWVVPDTPKLPELAEAKPILTTNEAYLRLHGRNKKDWYSKEKDRYNYDYGDDELDDILKIAHELISSGARKVYIFFNNCHHGQAAANAKKFAQLIGIAPMEPRLL